MRSDGGSAWLLARVPALTVAGTSRAPGRRRRLRAERLEYRTGGRTLTVQGLAWKDASWSWRPHAGAWIGLTLIEPRITRATVAATSPAQAPSAQAPAAPIDAAPAAGADAAGRAHRRTADRQPGAAARHQRRRDTRRPRRRRAPPRPTGLHLGPGVTCTPAARWPAMRRSTLDLQADLRSRLTREGAATPWQARANGARPAGCAGGAGRTRQRARCRRCGVDAQPAALCRLAGGVAGGDDPGPRPRQAGQRPADDPLDGPRRHRLARPGRADRGAHRRCSTRSPAAGTSNACRSPGLELELSGHARDRSTPDACGASRCNSPAGAGRVEGGGEWQGASAATRSAPARRAAGPARRPCAGDDAGRQRRPAGRRPALARRQHRRGGRRQSLQARLALDGAHDTRSALPVQISVLADAERSGAAWRVELRDGLARSGDARAQASLAVQRGADGAWRTAQPRRAGRLRSGAVVSRAGHRGARVAWRRGPNRLAGTWQADLRAVPPPRRSMTPPHSGWLWRGEAEFDLRDSLLAGMPLHGHAASSTGAIPAGA